MYKFKVKFAVYVEAEIEADCEDEIKELFEDCEGRGVDFKDVIEEKLEEVKDLNNISIRSIIVNEID